MPSEVTWTTVQILQVDGDQVEYGTPDEYGGLATSWLGPPHVQSHFIPEVGSVARVLKIGNVPFLIADVIAQDAITAREIKAGTVTALLLQGDVIVAGDAAADHVELTGAGMTVYVLDQVEGIISPAISLGTGSSDFFAVTDSTGGTVASISSLGAAQFADLSSTAWPQIGTGDWTGTGGTLDEILDRRPRGLVEHVRSATISAPTTTAAGLFEFSATLHPGRSYRLSGGFRVKSTVAGDTAELQVRRTTAPVGSVPAQPSLTSTVLTRASSEVNTVPRTVRVGQVFDLDESALPSSQFRFLLCYSRLTGTGSVSVADTDTERGYLIVEDIGPAKVSQQTAINTGGGGTVVLPPTQKTLSLVAAWSNPYKGDGTINTSYDVWQGQSASLLTGMRRSMIGFRELTELVGATIDSVTLRLNATGWAESSGGTAVVGFHSYLVKPTTSLSESPNFTADVDRSGVWTGLGVGYIDLTGRAPQEWATGAKRGIFLGLPLSGNDQSAEISGSFKGAPASQLVRPQLTITYTS